LALDVAKISCEQGGAHERRHRQRSFHTKKYAGRLGNGILREAGVE
jgi:hypothetical protein